MMRVGKAVKFEDTNLLVASDGSNILPKTSRNQNAALGTAKVLTSEKKKANLLRKYPNGPP
jgi:hypothetical protein